MENVRSLILQGVVTLIKKVSWLAVFMVFVFLTGVRTAQASDLVAYEDPSTGQAVIAVKDLCKALGWESDWDVVTQTVSVRAYGLELKIDMKNGTLIQNGEMLNTELVPNPQIKNGIPCVPLKPLVEAFGGLLEFQENRLNLFFPGVHPLVDIKYVEAPCLLGSYTITFSNLEARSPNFANACLAGQYLNGFIARPGDVVSFNAVVGPRTVARGFVPGVVFDGERKIIEIGGGVCRTATLLHNAVVAAGLEVLERHRHGQKVAYVPPGKDATVYYGVYDYCFRNNQLASIKLEFIRRGASITLNIWQLG